MFSSRAASSRPVAVGARVGLGCLLDAVDSVTVDSVTAGSVTVGGVTAGGVTAGRVTGDAGDAVLIEQIAALERLKAGCAAAQARLTATFAASQTADGAARKVRPDVVWRSIVG